MGTAVSRPVWVGLKLGVAVVEMAVFKVRFQGTLTMVARRIRGSVRLYVRATARVGATAMVGATARVVVRGESE